MLRERLLVHRVQTDVVVTGPVSADREPVRRLRFGRRFGELDLHAPEVAHELVPAVLEQAAPVLVHDVGVQALQAALARPRLGEIEQLRAETLPADIWMDARLVLEVGQVALAARAHVRYDLAVVHRDPRVVLETRLVDAPPLAQLLGGEPDRLRFAEVEAVAGVHQRGDPVGVVQRRNTYQEALQSGWPDSNRRLLRPKRSTLTRLSYTPKSLRRAYSVAVCTDNLTFGDLSRMRLRLCLLISELTSVSVSSPGRWSQVMALG
jgi:hypothetical protein